MPHAFDSSERLVTEKLSVLVETEPDPWVCGVHKALRVLYLPPCGLSQRLWDKPWAAKGILGQGLERAAFSFQPACGCPSGGL